MAVIEVKENNATLTKKNDEIVITKDDGDITINNSTNKGTDILSFDENDYSKGSFSTAKSGRDLVLTYTESDENSFTQNITIKNYFSKDGRSTSSSIHGYKLGETETKLTDLYINEINEQSYKKNTINGTMFNDLIIGTDNSDKIYTGAGDDVIIASKGNDTIYMNCSDWSTKTLKFEEKSDLTYERKVNDLIITVNNSKDNTVTIKDIFKPTFKANLRIDNGPDTSEDKPYIEELLKKEGLLTYDKSDANKGQKIVGTYFDETFIGSDKADKIYTGEGNDTIIASKGNDIIYMNEWGTKTLKFEEKSDLTYTRYGNDLKITVNGSANDTVTIKDIFKPTFKADICIANGEDIEYENPTLESILKEQGFLTYDKSDANKGQKIVGTYFGDTFIGSDKADKIYTGAGNDTIKSGKGNDTIYINGSGEKTFEFDKGQGDNIISGFNKADEVIIKFKYGDNGAITPTFTRYGNDLYINAEYDESNEDLDTNIKISGFFKLTEEEQNKLVGWESNTDLGIIGKGTIYGDDKNNVIEGSLKADKIYTGAGDDTIIADRGNDIINITDSGNKEICISDGDGNDTIYGIFNSTKTNISFMKEGEDTSEPNRNLSFNKSNNDLVIVRKAEIKGKEKQEYTIIKDVLNESFENISNKLTINGEKIDFSDESLFIHVDIAKQKKNAAGIYEGTDAKDVIHDINKNTIIAGGKGNDEIYLGKKGHTEVIIGDGDGVDIISGVDFDERNSVSINFTEATEFDIEQNQNVENYDYEINTGKGEGAIIDNIANINDNVELVASSEEDKTFDINGNISITSTSKNTNDTYNINYSSWEDIEIDDEGGNDVINFTDSVAEDDLVGFFDVAKSSKYEKKLTSDLIITRKNDLDSFVNDRELDMISISDYFDRDGYTINVNNGENTDQIFKKDENLDALKKDVVNFLKTTKYNTVSEAMIKGNKDIRQGLVDVFADGKNTYNIGHSRKTQTVTDNIGDNDVYNVNNKFNFAKDKLVISDLQGDNDVLNIAKKADDLTILFDIKKSASEGESAVGDALYVIGKGQTNLKHGIQMDGIDTIKTSDGKGGYTDITTPTNEIISDVQSWLKDANSGKGYDSVAEAIQNNDADLANLIAKFAPSQPQG